MKEKKNIENLNILIVDDNRQMLHMLKTVLESFGMTRIHTAKSGNEAFKRLCSKSIDVVITDLVMPDGDGIDFVRNIRNNPKSPDQYIPVIMISGHCEKARVINARDAGISNIMLKPFNARELYTRLDQIVNHPKKFIRSENFFGPDRRRQKQEQPYKGPFRRKTDQKNKSMQQSEIGAIQTTNNKIDSELVDLV